MKIKIFNIDNSIEIDLLGTFYFSISPIHNAAVLHSEVVKCRLIH